MGKIVVITGAGAGVGRATATEFARNGCDVALLSRDQDRLERAAAELRRFGVRALPIPTDVADPAAVDRAADQVERELGPIDVWVNVAMATVFAPVSKLTPAEVERDRRDLSRPCPRHDVGVEAHAHPQSRLDRQRRLGVSMAS